MKICGDPLKHWLLDCEHPSVQDSPGSFDFRNKKTMIIRYTNLPNKENANAILPQRLLFCGHRMCVSQCHSTVILMHCLRISCFVFYRSHARFRLVSVRSLDFMFKFWLPHFAILPSLTKCANNARGNSLSYFLSQSYLTYEHTGTPLLGRLIITWYIIWPLGKFDRIGSNPRLVRLLAHLTSFVSNLWLRWARPNPTQDSKCLQHAWPYRVFLVCSDTVGPATVRFRLMY